MTNQSDYDKDITRPVIVNIRREKVIDLLRQVSSIRRQLRELIEQ